MEGTVPPLFYSPLFEAVEANKKQKSREKNIALEEARKRTEASLARKRAANAALANGGAGDSNAQAASGAMDSLLEKLRAAAPQARDQRDRRRRARLKERHQMRVASGQKMPNLHGMGGDGSEDKTAASSEDRDGDRLSAQGETDTGSRDAPISDGEDIADRAANLLQGLRNNTEDDEERARRRRENAEEERRARRQRMRARSGVASGSKDSANGSLAKEPTSPKESKDHKDDPSQSPPPPATTVSTPAIVVSEDTTEGAT